MQIFRATDKGPLLLDGYFDHNAVGLLESFWGAPALQLDTVYREGDIFAPSTDNGFYYVCTRNGRVDVEPSTYTTPTVTIGTAVFQEMPWDLWLLPGQTVGTSIWFVDSAVLLIDGVATTVDAAASGVTISNENNTGLVTSAEVSLTYDTTLSFTVTNRAGKSGSAISDDRSFKLKVRKQ